jgi:phosphoribosylanthranilate isomerase
MEMRIKVCGMTKLEQLKALDEIGIDFTGLIFYPKSPRYVLNGELNPSDLMKENLAIKKVGVFVNETVETLLSIVKEWGLDFVQLHGDESPAYCEKISQHISIIKAFRIGENENILELTQPYKAVVSFYLFDTRGAQYGGTGEKFDWNLLKNIQLGKPYFLSGGLSPDDDELLNATYASDPALYSLDLNSKFEISPGIKDMNKIKQFAEKVKTNQ